MNPPPGQPLSRARVLGQFVRLILRRVLGGRHPGPYRFTYPPLSIHAAKNPWMLYREIFVRECYQPPAALGHRPRILDLGANIGLASLYFLTRWPDARISAFEPNPRAYELLVRNLLPSSFPGAEIRTEPQAVSTADGRTSFTIPTGNPTAVFASINRRATGQVATEEVVVPTIDAARLLAQPADLVKLDIEGHEYAVLDHALPEAGVIRSLIIEFHELGQNRDHCRDLLARLLGRQGYSGTDESGRPLDPATFAAREGAGVVRLAAR